METGLSTPTVKKYLNTLIQSGLLVKLYGFQLSDAKRHISSAKTYFIDNGILTAVSRRVSNPQLVESFVISEIEKRRRLGLIKCDELCYYESIGGREVDLNIDEPKTVTAIEIKSGKSISGRDIRNLREFNINSDKILKKIIYYSGSNVSAVDGIQIRPLASLFRSNILGAGSWAQP
jgi:predicted AAA+ superfamily ATPase